MFRKDFIDREFEKLGLLLGKILGLKKQGKAFEELSYYAGDSLREVFGDKFNLEKIDPATLSPEKQQVLADIFFELGTAAHAQGKPAESAKFLDPYLTLLRYIEKNSTTFSFQNPINRDIAKKILSDK